MSPNIYVGRCEGSAIYQKWYYEAIVDHIETVSHLPPHIRIGFANTEGFIPYPGGGENWGANGVGDDLFSYGFDGVNLWTGDDNYVISSQKYNSYNFVLITMSNCELA
jgi:ryanodine receptor 2